MQLVQFVLVFVHAMVPIFYDCNFPKVFSYVILSHGALFFALFSNFYIQSYTKKGAGASKTKVIETQEITIQESEKKKEKWSFKYSFYFWNEKSAMSVELF